MTDTATKSGKGSCLAGITTSLIGVSVLLGWTFDIGALKSIAPGLVAMNPVTGIIFFFAGISLVLSLRSGLSDLRERRWFILGSRLCALIVGSIGLIKLVGYLCGMDVGIDQYVFATKLLRDGDLHPNRVAPNTSLCFVLLGVALFFITLRGSRTRFCLQFLICLVSVDSLMAILGYAYNIQQFYNFAGVSPMALITGVTFLVMCVGFFLSQTDCGLLAIMAGDSSGGIMLRRLLPAAILIPAWLGWITVEGQKYGWYNVQFGEAAFAVACIVFFTAVVCWCSFGLAAVDGERQKAEHALRLLNSAVLQTKEAILITTADLDLPGPAIVFANPAFTKMTGYSSEEVLGKTPRILQGPMTDKQLLKNLRIKLDAGEGFEGETINYRKDGASFEVEWQIAPLTNVEGKRTHFVAIQRDITARRQAENEIRLNEQRYRSLVEATTAIVWETPASGEFEIPQPKWSSFTGQSFDELRGWGWLNAVHPEDRAETGRLWSDAVANRAIYICEHRLRAADGIYHDMMVRAVPILAPNGEIVQFIGIHSDITERKRTESRYRRLVDSNAQGVIFWNKTGKITGANDAFLKLVGYTRSDFEAGNVDWVKLTPPEQASIDQSALDEIGRTGFSSLYEKEYIRKDGTRIPILYGAAAFEDSPDEGVCFVVDLSERKRLEQQLFQSQKMETVGKLAGSIAHEFNSILTAIIGQSELMLGDPGASRSLIKSATEINKAALRATTLTQQILAYGRKQILMPEALDLNSVLKRMQGTLKHLMGLEISIRLDFAPDLKTVHADAGQIEQVIVNIALNAREAMLRGGKLTLETANVALNGDSVGRNPELVPGGYVMLAISDTGIGMTPEVRNRIFEPFFSTKNFGEAAGLGLSTSYGIIKQSGGYISAYTEPGVGTVLKIYLPQVALLPSCPITIPASTAPNHLPRGTETILLAEDDPSLLEMSATLLRRLGYTVLTAEDGLRALDFMQLGPAGHIDLLLTDVVMPHMSGKELSDRIKSIHPTMKVVFTSAYTENAIIHQGILNEGITLLPKPFTPSALAKKIREVLDKPEASL